MGNQTALDGVLIHRVIPIQLFQLHCHHIQGDSGGICNTLRNDSMCDSKQKVRTNFFA